MICASVKRLFLVRLLLQKVGQPGPAATGEHRFNKLRAKLGIKHRLTPPRSPQTNSLVEHFIVRMEAVLQSHRF